MQSFYELASTRRSIRKYTGESVDLDAVVDCVKAAVTAPSGCDSQCWKFVVVRDNAVIEALADAVVGDFRALASELGIDGDSGYMESKEKMVAFFRKAPVCVAVFMTKLEYYDRKLLDAFTAKGYTHGEIMRLYGEPDMLSLGAAIQNLLLALHEKGLGACWMNEPVAAEKAVREILGAGPGERLISLIPVGHPAYTPRRKSYKPMDEVLKIIG